MSCSNQILFPTLSPVNCNLAQTRLGRTLRTPLIWTHSFKMSMGIKRNLQRVLNWRLFCSILSLIFLLYWTWISLVKKLTLQSNVIKGESTTKTQICIVYVFKTLKKTQNTSLLLFSALFSESFVENLFNFFY